MARHHQDFARLNGQKRGGAAIGIGERLVDAQHLARDHGTPIELRRDALTTSDRDRERDADALPPQSAQRCGEIQPRIELVLALRDRAPFLGGPSKTFSVNWS